MADLKIGIKLDDKKAVKSVDSFEKKLNKVKKTASKPVGNPFAQYTQGANTAASSTTALVRKIGLAVVAIGGLTIAYTTLTRLFRDSTDAYREQIKEETKLQAALKATRFAIGLSKEEMLNMAASFQSYTTHSNSSIIATQALLVTFTKIGKEVFPDALEIAGDMSKMFGTSMKDSAIQLGKALNAPITGIGALARIGISFSEQQKESIKTFVEQNNIMEAQKVILDELRVEFGGVSREIALTDVGKLEQLENALIDIKAELGESLIPLQSAWNGLLLKTVGLINETVSGWKEILGFNDKKREALGITMQEVIELKALRKEQELFRDTQLAAQAQGGSLFNPDLLQEYQDNIASINAQIIDLNNTVNGVKPLKIEAPETPVDIASKTKKKVETIDSVWKWHFGEMTKRRATERAEITKNADTQKAAIDKEISLMEKRMAAVSDWERFLVQSTQSGLIQELSLIDMQHQERLDKQRALYDELIIGEAEYLERKKELETVHEEERSVAIEEDSAKRLSKIAGNSEQIVSMSMQIIDTFFQAQSNREDTRIKAYNKKESQKIKDLNVTNKRRMQLEKELNKEIDAQRKEQAEKEKAVAIAMALINGGIAVMKGYAQLGPIGGTVAAVLVAAMTAAQIAVISSQSFQNGGIVQNTQGTGIDKERANLTEGELVLTKSDQKQLLPLLRGGAAGGAAGDITMGNIVINGNVSESVIDQIKDTQQEQLQMLKENMEELQLRGYLSEGVLV